MKILDINDNELTTYDSNLGYLRNDTITRHVPAVEGVEEVAHYETIREYPNGGKDVERVIDVAGVEAVPEHDEEEQIYRYTLYTDKELAEREIITLKSYLFDTDYTVIKCMELGVSVADTYPEIHQKRADARTRINELEEVINDSNN